MRHILVTVAMLFCTQAFAFTSPLSVGILDPVQFPQEKYSVAGLRFSVLWGNHRDMYGLDFGLLGNRTQQRFVGSAISGVFNLTEGDTTIVGVQLAGLANVNTNKLWVYGVQAALGVNYNEGEAHMTGVQLAPLANLSSHTTVYGAQIGLYNVAREVYGFQIGLVNRTQTLHGIQIGLVNFHHTGLFYVSPILNVGF